MSPHTVRPPRVLYCTDTYPPQVNGVSVVTALSVAGLAERGWKCAVIAPRYDRARSGVPDRDIEVTPLPSVPMPVYPDLRLSAPNYPAIRAVIERFRPDLVHCATEFMIGAMGQRAARRAGIPVVSSYHTDFGRYTAAYGAPWLAGPVNRYVARFHQRSRRTFTPSGPARDDLRGMGVATVEVWGRGVDVRAFRPDRRNDAMRAAFAPEASVVFLHVGRLAAEKNVHVLLDAFRIAARSLPARAIHLVIAGAGPEERRLRDDAPPGVTFLGILDRQRMLPMLYASADAFLFSSLTETLGLVVLEAMSSGLPVIASPAGGVADHLRHGENGLAVAPANPMAMAAAIVELATEPDRRRHLSRGARATAERLSWSEEIDRLDRTYRELLRSDTALEAVGEAVLT